MSWETGLNSKAQENQSIYPPSKTHTLAEDSPWKNHLTVAATCWKLDLQIPIYENNWKRFYLILKKELIKQ
jgi:hypothetical protein